VRSTLADAVPVSMVLDEVTSSGDLIESIGTLQDDVKELILPSPMSVQRRAAAYERTVTNDTVFPDPRYLC